MLGYQWVRGGIDIGAYIGVDYQDYDLTLDDITSVCGEMSSASRSLLIWSRMATTTRQSIWRFMAITQRHSTAITHLPYWL